MAGAALLLVGGGRMGRALLEGWLRADFADRFIVIEPEAAARAALPADPRVATAPSLAEIPGRAAFCVLAVKPQVAPSIMADLAGLLPPGAPVLSIMAGRKLGWLEGFLGRERPILRAMPNTPAAIGKGFSVLAANAACGPAERELGESALAAVGQTAWVAEEGLMDAVTAVSGSGPAYVFLLIEALAEAGAKAGLPADLAQRLARATVVGAGALAEADPAPAADLRRAVTSPGGTTEAALKRLMAGDGLSQLMEQAVGAATARSRELAQ